MNEPLDIIAFDIGGTQGRCGIARCSPGPDDENFLRDASFEFIKITTLRRETGEHGPAWMERLISSAREISLSRPFRAAVSFGGPVGRDGSIQSMHVPGWENVDLVGAIARAFGFMPANVSVENDANAGALGEFRHGAGRGCTDMLYFTVSTGIGGGAILDGKLRRGVHGMAGEFGHMILDADAAAPQYAAGRPGALEALASGPAIARAGRAALLRAGLSVPDDFSAKDVFVAAGAGEAWAVETRGRCVAHLARGIAASVCAYDVERVVVGGGVALAGELLFDPLRVAVAEFLPRFMGGKVEVVAAALGDRAPMFGAVAAALDSAPKSR